MDKQAKRIHKQTDKQVHKILFDFSANSGEERATHVNEQVRNGADLTSLPTHTLEAIADYILSGSGSEDIVLEKKTAAWNRKEDVSIDAEVSEETSRSSETRINLSQDMYGRIHETRSIKAQRRVFDRNATKAALENNPELLYQFETLWTAMDVVEASLNFYEKLVGKRAEGPRKELTDRMLEENIHLARASGEAMDAKSYGVARRKLVEMRRQQYTMKDSYATEIRAKGEEEGQVAGQGMKIKPLGGYVKKFFVDAVEGLVSEDEVLTWLDRFEEEEERSGFFVVGPTGSIRKEGERVDATKAETRFLTLTTGKEGIEEKDQVTSSVACFNTANGRKISQEPEFSGEMDQGASSTTGETSKDRRKILPEPEFSGTSSTGKILPENFSPFIESEAGRSKSVDKNLFSAFLIKDKREKINVALDLALDSNHINHEQKNEAEQVEKELKKDIPRKKILGIAKKPESAASLKPVSEEPIFDFYNTEHIALLTYAIDDMEQEIEHGIRSIEDREDLSSLIDTYWFYVDRAVLSGPQREVLMLKIAGRLNSEIARIVNAKWGTGYSQNYVSTIFRKKCCEEIANAARVHYREIMEVIWQRVGFKRCSRCKRRKMRTDEFFIKRARSADGLAARCKECDKELREEKKMIGREEGKK